VDADLGPAVDTDLCTGEALRVGTVAGFAPLPSWNCQADDAVLR
jgi:hypothetical protein